MDGVRNDKPTITVQNLIETTANKNLKTYHASFFSQIISACQNSSIASPQQGTAPKKRRTIRRRNEEQGGKVSAFSQPHIVRKNF
jgi:hypothetical protein